jgi:transposase-like protein
MEDYPRTLGELEQLFSTDEACREYLFGLRWPEGFVCPRCSNRKCWAMARGLLLCSGCRRQVSVTAGTIFQDRRLPLVTWFRVIWYVTSQKNGASALGVKRALGFGSYQTAWTWLHKLRRAMVRPGRDRLSGVIDVDETYIGGEKSGKRGRGAAGKSLVVVAAQEDGEHIGRIRLVQASDASGATLCDAVQQAIAPGSTVNTDGWQGYGGLDELGYDHQTVRAQSDIGDNLLPNCHLVASLLKRWLLGTHQGAVRPKHLAYYLDEFTFRFNRRTSRSRGKLFYRLLQQSVQLGPQPYTRIVTPRPRGVG